MITDWPIMNTHTNTQPIDTLTHEQTLPISKIAINSFENLQLIIKTIRNIRTDYNVEVSKKIDAIIIINDELLLNNIKTEINGIKFLAKLNNLLIINSLNNINNIYETKNLQFESEKSTFVSENTIFDKNKYIHIIIKENIELYLPIINMIDPLKEIQRLIKQQTKLMKDILVLNNRFNSKGFIEKASNEIILEVKTNLNEKNEELLLVNKSLNTLQIENQSNEK